MPITDSDLAIEFWPAIGYAEHAALVDAWRQIHHAAQGLVELGKSWGDLRDDDAHSALAWSETDGGWINTGRGDDTTVLGWLDFGGASVWLERAEPQEGAWIELEGRTVADVRAWVRATAERLAGSGPRHEAVPAPDLPDHATARGKPLTLTDVDARGDLEAIYEGAGLLLQALRESLGERHGAAEDAAAPRLWPHHFDAASLFVVARDGTGAMTRTIGVGVTPPDGIEPAGYWYVSPWAEEGIAGESRWPDLPAGRWHDRGDGLRMAVLPLEALTALESGAEQFDRLASFVTTAFNACEASLGG